MFRFLFLFVFVLLSGLSCISASPEPRQDPLIDKIIHAAEEQPIDRELLLQKMIEADVVYLGEKHDNRYHHRMQSALIKRMISKGKKPVIGFEFFYQHQTSDLLQYVFGSKSPFQKKEPSPQEQEKKLRKQLGWQDRTNEEWEFYFNFIRFAKSHQLTVFGADLPDSLVKRMSRSGMDALTPVETRLLQPTGFEDPIYQKLMDSKFTASHCGWNPPELSEKLYAVWVARNDAMAQAIHAMLNEERQGPVVFIVGGGHVEHNMGIYERVAHLNPGVKQINLGFTEIFIDPAPLARYMERPTIDGRTFLPAHEYFWFTQRVDYDNPCEKFKMK